MLSGKIAYRNLPRRKARTILTVTAILLGVALLVGINIATASASGEFASYINKFWGATDVVVSYPNGLVFDNQTLGKVSIIPEVSSIAQRIELSGTIDNTTRFQLIGIDSNHDFDYSTFNITGTRTIPSGGVVVDNQIAQKYTLTIGSFVRVRADPGNITLVLTVVGINNPLRNIGSAVYTDLQALQASVGLQGKISRIYAALHDSTQAVQVQKQLQKTLGPSYDVTAPKSEAVTRIQGQTAGFQLGLNVMIAVALVVCSFIVFNTLYMTVAERTFEIGVMRAVGSSRSQIFRIFFTEGLLIGSIGSIAGVFAGLGLARFFTGLFESIFGFSNLPQAQLTPVIAGTGIAAGFAAVFAGSLYPSFSASRTNVMQAIRPSARNRRTVPRSITLAIGIIMFAFGAGQSLSLTPFHISYIDVILVPLGLVIIGGVLFGVFGRIMSTPPHLFSGAVVYVASKTGRRRLLRSTISFGIIAVTLSFTILIGGVQSGVQQALQAGIQEALGADIILVANQSIPIAFTSNLTSIPQVSSATPLGPAHVPSKAFGKNGNSSSVGILSVDPIVFPNIISYTFVGSSSSTEAYSRLASSNESLMLPEGLASRLGVSVGDSLTMLTATSQGNVSFLVAGIFTGPVLQYINFGQNFASDSIIISFKSEAHYFMGDYRSPLFLVNLKNHDKTQASNTAHEIAITYPKYDFAENSITLGQLLSLVNATISRIFALILLILYFALLIATLGIAATMIMNVAERRREIGLLRSQGMSRIQITELFLSEAVLIGIFGFLLAVPGGLLLLKGATSSTSLAGFWIPFMIPYATILQALPLALIAVLAGSLYPAVRASRMEITRALEQI